MAPEDRMPDRALNRAFPSSATRARRIFTAAFVAATLVAGSAFAETCQNASLGFDRWLADFKKEAAAKGISQKTISAALDNVSFDQGIVNRDRRQSVFAQDFLQFSTRMVAAYRLQRGAQLIKQHDAIFDRIEKEFGVPAAVITAFWGLETDFGAVMGDLPTLRSLASLAYDCRRPDLFRDQLHAALQIIERGDLTPSEMIGAWAGELGQMQFMLVHYANEAVDYDGDGKRNLIRSTPDVLASTANHLKNLGWRRGQPWLQEVRVPDDLAWQDADLAIRHPRSEWARRGVTAANGKTLEKDDLPAALLLPMGRHGPAFLAYPNFEIYLEWNQSLTYTTTAAYFATRLAGAPALNRGNVSGAALGFDQVKEMQRLLSKQGYDVGEADGKLGAATRAGVKAAQIKLGLPADSYPTAELLDRLRTVR